MPRADDMEWIEFTDFSPGIFSNNNLAGGVEVTATNPAMAQVDGTYRCLPLPTGGLGPGPRRTNTYDITTVPESGNGYTYYIRGMDAWGGVYNTTGIQADNADASGIHLAIDYFKPTVQVMVWLLERLFESPISTTTVLTKTFDWTTEGIMEPTSGVAAYFLRNRLNITTPTDPGVPVMGLVWGSPASIAVGASDDTRISRAFPNPDSVGVNGTVVIGSETYASRVAGSHQGRFVFADATFYGVGLNAATLSNGNFRWTAVNDNTLSSDTAATFVPEADYEVTEMAAMSANQLLVICQAGGGFVLQGDLDDVTVVRLPNLASAEGSPYVTGCSTAVGYIYSAGDAGLYIWNGGDQAEDISQQLNGDFATESQTLGGAEQEGSQGKCARWQDLVLVPNNWVYHTPTKSWWRIEDPTLMNLVYWSVSRINVAYGAIAEFTDATTEIFTGFKVNDLAYTYSWQSHPLWVSRDRFMEVRQGVVALQGHGTVTITFIDQDGNTDAHTITVNSSTIRNYRFNAALDADNLQVKIEASGDNGGGAGTYEAPLVHRLYIGYRTAQHLPLTES